MRTKLLTKLAAFSLLATSAFGAGEGWMTDFEAAKKKATAENKDLLVEFTGSDWCPPCKMLNKNVFSKPEFVKEASEKFVLVALDFPNEKVLPEAEKAQNDKLIAHYGVEGFPTVLLCDANGIPYAANGFQQGGPEEYLATLTAKMPAKEAFKKEVAEAEKLEGKAKAEALWKAIGSLEGVPVAMSLEPVLKSIGAADPTDIKIEGININAEMAALKEGDDIKPVFKKYDEYIAKQKLEGIQKQELLTRKIDILYNMKDFDGMRTLFDEIIAVDPESEIGKGLAGAKPRIDMAEEAYKKEQADKAAEKKSAEPAEVK